MCGILKETKAAQQQILRQAMAHLQTIEHDYGRASAIGFAQNLGSTRNKKVANVKQLLLTAKEEHEAGITATGNIIMNSSARLNELMKRASDLDEAIKGVSNKGIVVFRPGAVSTIHEGRISSLTDLKTLTEEMIQKGILTKFEFNEVDNWVAEVKKTAAAAQQTAAVGWSPGGGPDPEQGGGSLKRTSRKKISHHSRNKRKNRKASRKYKNL